MKLILRNYLENIIIPKGSLSRKKNPHQKSPYHDIELELSNEFVHWREKGIKASDSRICIAALRIFDAKKLADPQKWGTETFKVSHGWMRRFMSRKNIKFCKRKWT